MQITITEIGKQVIDFRIAVKLSNGCTLLITPTCLKDLNWQVGMVVSK